MAATAATQKEKDPVNIVHQNAIFCETILKEQRHQKLYTSYGVNPYKKSKHSTSVTHVTFELQEPRLGVYASISVTVYVLAGKPNSQHDSADGVEDGKSVVHILCCRLV